MLYKRQFTEEKDAKIEFNKLLYGMSRTIEDDAKIRQLVVDLTNSPRFKLKIPYQKHDLSTK